MLNKLLSLRAGAQLALFLSLAALLSLGMAREASADLFTLDFNNNDVHEVGGPDDRLFNFCGSSTVNQTPACAGPPIGGEVDGVIKAVDILNISAADINVAFSTGTVNWATQDVFIFEVTLFNPSAPLDEIGVGMNIIPLFGNPSGAGVLTGTGVLPSSITVSPFVTLSANFFFGGAPSAANPTPKLVEAGETTIRMFVTYNSTGILSDDNFANFMMSSGAGDTTFGTNIAPEPSAVMLLLLGGAAVAARRRRRA